MAKSNMNELNQIANKLHGKDRKEFWLIFKAEGEKAAIAFQEEVSKRIDVDLLRDTPVEGAIWGSNIEQGALDQFNNASRLSVARKAALMPDAHQGYGLPIGGVLALENAISPYAVGVDIGCFTGDTKIPTLDGKNHTIEELCTSGERIFVWSRDNDKVVASEAYPIIKDQLQEIIEIELDNGEVVSCTLDHPFMLRDGSYVNAADLEIGTSLMPFYSKQDKDGYRLIYQNKTRTFQRAHWIAARSGILGEIPSFSPQKTVIHHKDFNESNNLPDNLQFMGDKDHSTYHRSLVERNEHWQSEEFENKRKEAIHRKAQTPEGHEEFSKRAEVMQKYWREHPEELKLKSVGNGQRGKEYLVANNQSEAGRAKSKETFNRIYICDICGKEVKSPGGMTSHLISHHSIRGGVKHLQYYNHKVVAIRRTSRLEKTYCLTVPKYENFAIAAGVFVHNCRMRLSIFAITDSDGPWHPSFRQVLIEQTRFGMGAMFKPGDIGGLSEHPVLVDEHWDMDQDMKQLREKAVYQLGTSGGGNHFVEWGIVTIKTPSLHAFFNPGDRYLALLSHSGSRGIGAKIADKYSKLAMKMHPRLDNSVKHLAWFDIDSEEGQKYWIAMNLAGRFAQANHEVIHERIAKVMGIGNPITSIENHHNFCWIEGVELNNGEMKQLYVHRKGATPAGDGVLGVIPGSMATPGYVVRGKGVAASINSASHGAGRAMSRTKAIQTLDMKQWKTQLLEANVDLIGGSLDEATAAYKDITSVMAAQTDLVSVEAMFQPRIVRMADDGFAED